MLRICGLADRQAFVEALQQSSAGGYSPVRGLHNHAHRLVSHLVAPDAGERDRPKHLSSAYKHNPCVLHAELPQLGNVPNTESAWPYLCDNRLSGSA